MLKLTQMQCGRLSYIPSPSEKVPVELQFQGILTKEEAKLIADNYSGGGNYTLELSKKHDPVSVEIKAVKDDKVPAFGGAWYVKNKLVYITRIIYSGPATIVFWNDGDKTMSKCATGDTYSAELGLSMAILKKILGTETVAKTMTDWLPESSDRSGKPEVIDIKNLRAKRQAAIKATKKAAKANK